MSEDKRKYVNVTSKYVVQRFQYALELPAQISKLTLDDYDGIEECRDKISHIFRYSDYCHDDWHRLSKMFNSKMKALTIEKNKIIYEEMASRMHLENKKSFWAYLKKLNPF